MDDRLVHYVLIEKADKGAQKHGPDGRYVSGGSNTTESKTGIAGMARGFSAIRKLNKREIEQKIKADELTTGKVHAIIESLDKKISEAKSKRDGAAWVTLTDHRDNYKAILNHLKSSKPEEQPVIPPPESYHGIDYKVYVGSRVMAVGKNREIDYARDMALTMKTSHPDQPVYLDVGGKRVSVGNLGEAKEAHEKILELKKKPTREMESERDKFFQDQYKDVPEYLKMK